MHCGELATFAEAVTATLGRRPAGKPCVADSERPHDLALEGSRAVPEPAANWSAFFFPAQGRQRQRGFSCNRLDWSRGGQGLHTGARFSVGTRGSPRGNVAKHVRDLAFDDFMAESTKSGARGRLERTRLFGQVSLSEGEAVPRQHKQRFF